MKLEILDLRDEERTRTVVGHYVKASIELEIFKNQPDSVAYKNADAIIEDCVAFFTSEQFKEMYPDVDPARFMETLDYEVLRHLKKHKRGEVS